MIVLLCVGVLAVGPHKFEESRWDSWSRFVAPILYVDNNALSSAWVVFYLSSRIFSSQNSDQRVVTNVEQASRIPFVIYPNIRSMFFVK